METTTREIAGIRIDLYSKLLRRVLHQGRIRLLLQRRRQVVVRQVQISGKMCVENITTACAMMHIDLQGEEEIEIHYLRYVRMVGCSCENDYVGGDDGEFDDSSEHVVEFSLLEDNHGLSFEVVDDSFQGFSPC